MRFVLMLWVTFRGMRSHAFKQSYAMVAESRKVPLEIFSNPTILSDDNLFWSSPIFSHLPMDYKPMHFSVELALGVDHND